jgi:hypothetical protein
MTQETNQIIGAKSALFLYDEDTWGEPKSSPTYFAVPVTNYGVEMNMEYRETQSYLGVFEEMHNQPTKGMPQGQLVMPLYGFWLPSMGKSLMQYMLEWAFANPEDVYLPSKGAEWSEGPDIANKRHYGLRVNTATLVGSADTGNWMLTLDLMGRWEVGLDGGTSPAGTSVSAFSTARTLPTNRYKLVQVQFAGTSATLDSTFYLGPNGNELVRPKSFQLQLQNNLAVEYNNGFVPDIMPRTGRKLTAQYVLQKNADTYDAYNRLTTATELVGQVIFRGRNMGTGSNGMSWSVGQLDLPRMSFKKKANQGGFGAIYQPLDFKCEKPQTSSPDLTMTFSEAA